MLRQSGEALSLYGQNLRRTCVAWVCILACARQPPGRMLQQAGEALAVLARLPPKMLMMMMMKMLWFACGCARVLLRGRLPR